MSEIPPIEKIHKIPEELPKKSEDQFGTKGGNKKPDLEANNDSVNLSNEARKAFEDSKE